MSFVPPFMAASEIRPPVAVDVKTPSPEPQHSIQRIQRSDQLQAQIQSAIQAQNMQARQQGPQGFVPGG